jgi:hypothetical protein
MKDIHFSNLKFLVFILLLTFIANPVESFAFPYELEELPISDGTIQDNEYSSVRSFQSGLFSLYWTINDSTIYVGMVGQTEGWISIGFDPTTAMLDADLYYGWVESNGSAILYDAYSRNAYGSDHPKDVDIAGGMDDIIAFNGSEEAGLTTIEFSRSLSTGDSNDNDIPKTGTIDIIWAIGNADSFTSPHSQTGKATLTMGEVTETTTTSALTTSTTEPASSPGFELMIFFGAIGILLLKKKEKRRD